MLTTNKSIAEKPTIFEKKLLDLLVFFKISTLPSNCKKQPKEKSKVIFINSLFCSEAVPNAACVQLIILRKEMAPVALTEGPFLFLFRFDVIFPVRFWSR